MAEEKKSGEPWAAEELDAVVAAYFAALEAEYSRRPRETPEDPGLARRFGRTHGSVDTKNQEISAVLEELGLPWIAGYKPRRDFQPPLLAAIDRYLSSGGESFHRQPPAIIHHAEDERKAFVDPPKPAPAAARTAELDRLIHKFDPARRDFRNRALGNAGEEFVLNLERKMLTRAGHAELARKVRWVARDDGDGTGYDILSFDPGGEERLIEVKTTNGAARTPFFLLRNELEISKARAASWRLYRVHLFAQGPRVFVMKPPIDGALHLVPSSWRATFGG